MGDNNADRIKIGIRPEDLLVHKENQTSTLTMGKEWVPMGEFKASSSNYSQGNFMVSLQDQKATLKINALSREVINPGDMVELFVNKEKIKFFTLDTGEMVIP